MPDARDIVGDIVFRGAEVGSSGGLFQEQLDWLAWVRAKADWLDPLIQVSDPILDAPEPKRPGYW